MREEYLTEKIAAMVEAGIVSAAASHGVVLGRLRITTAYGQRANHRITTLSGWLVELFYKLKSSGTTSMIARNLTGGEILVELLPSSVC